MNKRDFSPEFADLLKSARKLGIALAEEGNLDEAQVKHLLIPKARKEIVKKLSEDGLSQRDIADMLDVSQKTISRDLAETNVSETETNVSKNTKETLETPPLPSGEYDVIYADPPWRFEPYSRETGMDRAADNHYQTMQLEDIKALQVPAAKDCALFLWTTSPLLPEGLEVMKAWGFTYKSRCIWHKHKIGTGYWFRDNAEILLVGTKGNIRAPAQGKQYPSVFSERQGKHSAKPFAFHEMIEEYYPEARKLEMFAREKFEGWDAWGNEVGHEPAA